MLREIRFAAVLLAALASAGCGIKGPLVPPPAAMPPATTAPPAASAPATAPAAPGATAPTERKP